MTLNRRSILVVVAFALFGLGVAAIACQGAAAPTVIPLTTLNNSAVTGTVKLTDLGTGKTRVEVVVDPAGHPDMPAHIHPGTCDALVPQPKFPLENVRSGVSVTEVPASLGELIGRNLAVNLHKSVDDLKTYTACADLK
jgi:hypothetical protein